MNTFTEDEEREIMKEMKQNHCVNPTKMVYFIVLLAAIFFYSPVGAIEYQNTQHTECRKVNGGWDWWCSGCGCHCWSESWFPSCNGCGTPKGPGQGRGLHEVKPLYTQSPEELANIARVVNQTIRDLRVFIATEIDISTFEYRMIHNALDTIQSNIQE